MKKPILQKVHSLGVISFLTGFSLMAYELVAARLLAPTVGSSIYVWTSVIGVIIASLSLGYWLGGKVADARNKAIDVALLCLAAALCVVMTILSQASMLASIAQSIEDTRLQGVVASLLLFAPTSFVLGLIGPYLAKLNIRALETAGESVANLSALNSIGGIVGTFVTGFFFFSYIGSKETLIIVVACLVASSWLIVPKQYLLQRVIVSLVFLSMAIIASPTPKGIVASIDTPSAHYDIGKMTFNNIPITTLATGPGGIQSAVYSDGYDDLVFWYTQYAAQVIESQNPKRVLILGGGAFTLPTALASALPDTEIDVVEIDPALEDISKEYFQYKDAENINLIFKDARSFVNTTKEHYDVIFVDVYGDSYVSFSLLTQEYGSKINTMLKQNGIVVMNAIVGLDGPCKPLLNAIEGTYRPYFPFAYWDTESNQAIARGNYILAFSRNNTAPLAMRSLENSGDQVIYSDNFMPAEQLHFQCSFGNS